MLQYLLRRLALVLPVLFLVSLAVFLLGDILPGDQADQAFDLDDPRLAAADNREAIRASFEEMRKRSRLDLPVFYVGFGHLGECDTLDRVYPASHRQWLEEMSFRYGNWEGITHLYKRLETLRKSLDTKLAADARYLTPYQIWQNLHDISSPQAMNQQLAALSGLAESLQDTELSSQVAEVSQAHEQLTQSPQAYKRYMPALWWNGFQNRYHQWIIGIFTLDFGKSDVDQKPVALKVGRALSVTLSLTVVAIILLFAAAIPIGMSLGRRLPGLRTRVTAGLLIGLDAVPLFLLCILAITFLANREFLRIFPTYGLGNTSLPGLGWFDKFSIRIYHLALPVICMVLAGIPYVAKQLEGSIRLIYDQLLVIAARARGLSEQKVQWKHAFSAILFPLISLISGYLPAAVSGALVVEVIFSIPGMGKLVTDAVFARDFPVIVAVVMIVAVVKLLSNLLADMAYFLTDPRVRYEQ